MKDFDFDVIIIGGGIAGLTSALYLARAGKKTAVIEKNVLGGQILSTPDVENYPGFLSISGYELIEKIKAQAEKAGAQIIYDNVTDLTLWGNKKKIKTLNGEYTAMAVILAMGSQNKTLGLKNESELTGSGVSYCATCDGAFFKDKTVMVAGSGKTAVADVEYLAQIVKKVYVVSKKPVADLNYNNVEIIENAAVAQLIGNPLQSVKITQGSSEREIEINGLFVAAGYSPSTFLVKDLVELNEKGYIITDSKMRTNVEGVYAAGDIREKDFRQLITAAADGATAAHEAGKLIKKVSCFAKSETDTLF